MEGGWCVSSVVSTAGGTARAMGDLEKEEPYIRHLCPRSAVDRIRYFVQRIKFKLLIKLLCYIVMEYHRFFMESRAILLLIGKLIGIKSFCF